MVQLIGNRYEILGEIGAGGMGIVYRGQDQQTEQIVAIKQLHTAMSKSEHLERFKREGEALRELNHPNIVKMLDAIEESGSHYLIMEYVAGGDLNSLLENGQLNTSETLRIAIDLSDALTRAHKLNIIHRDLKPANILIDEGGTLHLTDFGVAHFASKERVTQTDSIVGTIDYLAPETFSGGVTNTRTDIWAFGIILFEMLSGQRPFSGETMTETLFAITSAAVPDLEALRPDIPVALVDLVYRMLERDSSERISSVRYVGTVLESIQQGDVMAPVLSQTRDTDAPIPDIVQRQQHNLPTQTTAFIGRETELEQLEALISDPQTRLITVVAAGGMGKSRLCLEAARRQLPNFRNGAYLIELASLSSPDDIISAIANVTGYQLQQDGRNATQQLQEYLSYKQMLLLIDNFEHLMTGVEITTAILQAAPEVNILVTSRQRLNQSGERLFLLEGMDFAELEKPEEALHYAAIQLFVQSAQRIQPQFELNIDNVKDVARICALVQGMPLGIVLAAGWTTMLQPAEIVVEIETSLDFLESDLGDLPERQRSMQAIFDYSWNLMDEAQQQVFSKLSIFRGGFTREAAQAVAGAGLRTLMALNNMSLIHRDAQSGRYEVQGLLRQYAEERLIADATLLSAVRDAHTNYFADLMLRSWQLMKTGKQRETVAYLDPEIENLRIAWHDSVAKKKANQILKFVHALWLIHEVHGWHQAGDDLITAAIEALQVAEANTQTSVALAILLSIKGYNLTLLGNVEQGLVLSQEATAIYDSLPAQQAQMLIAHLGTVMCYLSSNEGALLEEAALKFLAGAQEAKDLLWEGIALNYMCPGLAMQGRLEEARARSQDSVKLLEGHGDHWAAYWAYFVNALMAMASGELDIAQASFGKTLHIALELNYRRGIQQAYDSLGDVAFISQDFVSAEQQFRGSLRISDETGQIREMLVTLYDVARCKKAQGSGTQAVELISTALHHPLADIGIFMRTQATTLREAAEELRVELEADLAPDIYQAAWSRGQSQVFENVVAELLAEEASVTP